MQCVIYKIFFVSPILKKKKSLIPFVLFMSFLLFLAFGMLPGCNIYHALFPFSLTASKSLFLWYSENHVAVISYVKVDCTIKIVP